MNFLEIHDQFYERVRKFILASVRDESAADDLVQEAFMKIQQNLESVRDPGKVSSWVFRIAHNLCQDHFRTQKKLSSHEEIHEGLVNLQETPLQKRMEQSEMSQCVQNQLNLLPESLRSVLILSDVVELSQQEIADILGLTTENVKVRLHRARKKFSAILKEECTFELDERNILVCEPVDKNDGG
jgi:RNA polymerase sigma-70 factor (ECF subfamily)